MHKKPLQKKMGAYEKIARGIVVDSQRGIGSHGRPKGSKHANKLTRYQEYLANYQKKLRGYYKKVRV